MARGDRTDEVPVAGPEPPIGNLRRMTAPDGLVERVRTSAAAKAARFTAAASRRFGGEGRTLSGRVFLALASPDGAQRMARRQTTVLVSGTNGKTTTTTLIVRGLGGGQPLANNSSGANLTSGVFAALVDAPDAQVAVLEVDEIALPAAIAACQPRVVALLNLSRDQMDRMHEVRRIGELWHDALAGRQIVVVANADDPLIVHAVRGCPDVVWVGAGQPWRGDATACPACAAHIEFTDDGWGCPRCPLRRPDTGTVEEPPATGLPGRCNEANAAMAYAVLGQLGRQVGVEAWAGLEDVAGRYQRVTIDGREVRLLLAKNPAGWLETLTMLGPGSLVLALNARSEDGRDPSWIWDVPFETLTKVVVCTGERAADLAVRIDHAGLATTIEPDVLAAVRHHPPGPVDVIANYSAFREARARLFDGG